MNTLARAFVLLLAMPQTQPIGKVGTTADTSVNFAGLHTYVWEKGHEAFNPDAHKAIVSAVDAEMASLGFIKSEAGKADVIVKYHAVAGTDVDMKMLEKWQKEGHTDPAPTTILGTVAVVMFKPGGTKPIWEAHTRSHLSDDAAARSEEIKKVVASLFAMYPTRQPQKKH
jgi:cold shock CspA family protein